MLGFGHTWLGNWTIENRENISGEKWFDYCKNVRTVFILTSIPAEVLCLVP